jgi:hypothetical protein
MLISSILILGINAIYRQAHKLFSSAEDRRPAYNTTRLITETLRQELSCLYMPPAAEDVDSTFELVYVPDQRTELTFYTMTPSWKGGLETSRPAKVRYEFTKDSETEQTRLERYEQWCAAELIIGSESSDVITESLSDFRVWILEPNSDEWQPQAKLGDGNPPRAVRISLEFPAEDHTAPETFQTDIFIPTEVTLIP